MEFSKKGLYVPDSVAGYENPSHFILNIYALNHNRYSSMKERLMATRTKDYFVGLQQDLEADISKHYLRAKNQRCKEVIWSNEGLYLLNSEEEYKRLRNLFDKYSSCVICVCCFREVESYRRSYAEQLRKQGISLCNDKDSYRCLNVDSWLFDYERKKRLLEQVFDEVITFPYDRFDNVKAFLRQIGYSADNSESIHLNVTKYT